VDSYYRLWYVAGMHPTGSWPSVRRAAARLGSSRQYTEREIAKGRLRAVETALGRLVDPESLEQYLRERDRRRALRKARRRG
jgi:excisionase family DNA binding protein